MATPRSTITDAQASKENTMRKSSAALLGSALFLAVAASAFAADTKPPKPIVVKDKITIKATVEAIDKGNRTLTLKGPKGNLMTLPVDESVQRFDNVKVGDTVTADYYESVAYDVRKPGSPATPDAAAAKAGALPGEKPAGAVMGMTVTTVTIEAIDPTIPAVSVRTADGNILSFRIQHKKNLEGVNVGDQVVITQTAALVISVEAAK
jgi:hypothetical protein